MWSENKRTEELRYTTGIQCGGAGAGIRRTGNLPHSSAGNDARVGHPLSDLIKFDRPTRFAGVSAEGGCGNDFGRLLLEQLPADCARDTRKPDAENGEVGRFGRGDRGRQI